MIFTRPNLLLTSGVLLFGFLLLLATLATRRQRQHPLLHKITWLAFAGGVLGYVNGGAAFVAALIGAAAFTYAVAGMLERALARRDRSAARRWLAAGVAVNAVVLAAMKYAHVFDFSAGMRALGAGRGIFEAHALVPIGLSFLTFHAVSYLMDTFRGRAGTRTSASQTATYLLLLPQFVAGPLPYRSVAGQLSRRAVGMSDFSYGIRRLVIGIGKRVLIARVCAAAANDIFAWQPDSWAAPAAWLALACFTIQIYFTFSGYADMAIGLGRLFGFRLEENFKWPYEAGSVRGFWERWHVGLTAWFREYCLPEMRVGAMWGDVAVVLLCAAWYGATWGCVAWGVYHSAFLLLERRRIVNVARFPAPLRHVYLVLVVMAGWVFFRVATPGGAWLFFKAMAGQNTIARVRPLPVSLELWVALAAGAVGSAPVARALRRWSVAIDAATTSLLMMIFATAVFVWRCGAMVVPRKRRAAANRV